MLGPDGPDLLIGYKFTVRGGGFRGRDGGALFSGERHRRLIIRTGKPENDAGDVVLSARRERARRFKRLFEKFGHRVNSNMRQLKR